MHLARRVFRIVPMTRHRRGMWIYETPDEKLDAALALSGARAQSLGVRSISNSNIDLHNGLQRPFLIPRRSCAVASMLSES